MQHSVAGRDPQIGAEVIREVREQLQAEAHVAPRVSDTRHAGRKRDLKRLSVAVNAAHELGVTLQARREPDSSISERQLEPPELGERLEFHVNVASHRDCRFACFLPRRHELRESVARGAIVSLFHILALNAALIGLYSVIRWVRMQIR